MSKAVIPELFLDFSGVFVIGEVIYHLICFSLILMHTVKYVGIVIC